jgi:hypothetical protein
MRQRGISFLRWSTAWSWFCTAGAFLILVAGCTSGTPSAHQPIGSPTPTATASTPTQPLGGANCRPSSPIAPSALGFPETPATITQGSGAIWALLMPVHGMPIRAQEDVKIIWKLTGSGTFQVVTRGPNGQHAVILFGPDFHSGTNWNRPGEEWGTGFRFPVAGCWDLHASRETLAGDVWLAVA